MKGFSLLEVIIALAIFSLGLMGMATATRFAASGVRHLTHVSVRDRMVAGLITSISSNPHLYQVTNIAVGTTDPIAKNIIEERFKELPIAWSKNFFGNVKDCPTCSGRLGYVIQPLLGVPGLFQISVRATSTEIFKGKSSHERNYRFLVSLN